MKVIWLLACCILSCELKAQLQSDGIKVQSTNCITRFSKDTLSLDLTIAIINNSSTEYYYPKAFEQKAKGMHLYHSFKSLVYHSIQNLTFDIGTVGYNSYDTIITIKPSDTLFITYTDIPLYPKGQTITINSYVFPNKQAIKSNAGGSQYLDRYTRGVKIIEYSLTHGKGKVSDALTVRNYLNF